MKKIQSLLALLPLLAVTACSNDESIEPASPAQTSTKSGEIAFAPTFDRSTRAATVYDSNNIPSEFTVGAFHIDSVGNRKPFFLGDVYQKVDGTWKNTTGTRYWPDGGSTDFYALVMEAKPVDANMNIWWNEQVMDMTSHHSVNLPSAYIQTYTVDQNATNQYDLLYAVAKDVHRSSTPVPLNFRHALTQVVFDAQNVSKNIYVEISGVSVENINMHFGLTLPNKTTSASALNDETTFAKITALTQGYSRSRSFATFPTVSLAGNPDESVAATSLTRDDKSLAMLLSPAQGAESSEPDPTQPNSYSTDTKFVFPYRPNPANPMLGKGGQALKVKCTIWEVKDPSKGHDPSVDVELWGDKAGAPKELIIPVDITNWKPGKRILYTLVFGKGSAGYDPANDTPVLAPITYDITVDDFVDMNSKIDS